MSSSSSSDLSLETVAPRAAVTSERKLNPDLQEQVPKPCTYPFPHLDLGQDSECSEIGGNSSAYLPFFVVLVNLGSHDQGAVQ
jgi:hypothetical protein